MTFFANAGVKWPTIQSELRQAGTYALSGGADLWQLLSEIEGWQSDKVTTHVKEETIKKRCLQELQNAADTYSSGIKTIGGDDIVAPFTLAELGLAAVPFNYDGLDGYVFRDGSIFRGVVTTRDLYNLLIARIRHLSSQVETLDLKSDRRNLTYQVFRIMREWESVSSIARVIAVVNLRNDSGELVAR
jgi:hypothetical protein